MGEPTTSMSPQDLSLRVGTLGCPMAFDARRTEVYGQADDLAMMDRGLAFYDALYAWGRFAAPESHGWPPATSA